MARVGLTISPWRNSIRFTLDDVHEFITAAEQRASALAELKFQEERRKAARAASAADIIEKHYTPKQVAAQLGVSADTIRGLLANDPDVLRITKPSRLHRRYVTMLIPQSAIDRLKVKLQGRAGQNPKR